MNNNKLGLATILLVLISLGQQQVYGWGMTGHRVISEIAERHLTKKAKKNIEKIIGKQKIAYWSNWADFIKSDPDPALNKTGSWHFVNTDANLSFEDFNKALNASPENNLYKSYLRVKGESMEKHNLSLQQKQHNLYYIIHLFADAHQPMHVSRAEDQGGNKIEVSFFGRKTNIHRVWDSELVDNEQYSYTEYASVLDVFTKKDYARYNTSFEQTLYESHQLANRIYKDVEYNANLSYKHIYDYKYIMEECLLKAGIRLAHELNEIYGK